MKKQNSYVTTQCLIIAVLILICTGMVYASSSPNYQIKSDVISGGGGAGSSTNYDLSATIGQATPITISSSTTYANFAGFWHVMASVHERTEIVGAWSSGIWYWNPTTSGWTKMNNDIPSGPMAAGDITGDGRADVASVWPSGLWYQNGATLGWTKVYSMAPSQIAVGDISGDGRTEIVGAWSTGIWYWNPAISGWTKMNNDIPSGPMAAGDITGDGRADVASVWPSGLWYQNGATLGLDPGLFRGTLTGSCWRYKRRWTDRDHCCLEHWHLVLESSHFSLYKDVELRSIGSDGCWRCHWGWKG